MRPFLADTTPVIRDQLRPFARDVQPTVRELRPAARDLAVVTPRLTTSLGVVNQLLNELAYNPPGSEEGYLFWTAWLNHARRVGVRQRRTRTARSAAASS